MTRLVGIVVAGRPIRVERKGRRSSASPISSKRFTRQIASDPNHVRTISMFENTGGFAPSSGVEKRDMSVFSTALEGAKVDIGCATPEATKPENRADLSTAGLLVADVCRLIRPATGSFDRDLWGAA